MPRLQWVHGRITVVIDGNDPEHGRPLEASMGPRSDNRGYGRRERHVLSVASMGPRSDNRGYGSGAT